MNAPAGARDDVAEALTAVDNALAAERAARAPVPPATDPAVARIAREVMASLREPKTGVPSPAVATAPVASIESDPDWFRANPSRAVRLRERRRGDPEAYWLADALAGAGVMMVVRFIERDSARAHGKPPPATVSGLTTEILRLGGKPVVDTDDDILAALRASHGRR